MPPFCHFHLLCLHFHFSFRPGLHIFVLAVGLHENGQKQNNVKTVYRLLRFENGDAH